MLVLSKKELEEVSQIGTVREYQEQESIYHRGDAADCLYIVRKGRVRVYTLTRNGEEVNYDVLEKGRILGEGVMVENSVRPVSAMSITESELIVLSVFQVEHLLKTPIGLTLFKMIAEAENHLTELVRGQREYNRYQKVASFLLKMTRQDSAEKEILHGVLPYTHQEVADSVQLTRVTVSKVLNLFEQQGYIRMKYKHIQVLDREGLYREYLG